MDDNYLKRQLLARQLRQQAAATKHGARGPATGERRDDSSYESFSASELYCPTCKMAMPVREKMLLALPRGDLYDYCCKKCGTSLGTRRTG